MQHNLKIILIEGQKKVESDSEQEPPRKSRCKRKYDLEDEDDLDDSNDEDYEEKGIIEVFLYVGSSFYKTTNIFVVVL